jgi:hypothetical protein
MKKLTQFIDYLDNTELTFEEKAKIIAIFSDKECKRYTEQNGKMTSDIAYEMIRYGGGINPKTILKKDPAQTIIMQKHWNRAINDNPFIYHGIPRPFVTEKLGKLHVIHKLNHMGPKQFSSKDDFLKKFRKSQIRALIAHTSEKDMSKVMKQLKIDTDLRRKDPSLITYDDCFNAVDIDPLQIKYVPDVLLDKELCIMAVYRKGSTAFNYIKSKFMSKAMVVHAIKNDETIHFKNISKKFMTEEIYYLLIKFHRILLCHVPEEMRTPIMCMLAVYADNYSYESIPENIKNEYKSVLDSLMVE